jgi:2,3-dihydroxybenzoate decarboxylase
MLGKIALEEAFNPPDYATFKSDVTTAMYTSPTYQPKHAKRIVDVKDERIKSMDKYGVGYTVLSLTVPGIQGIKHRAEAESEATRINDWIANEIKDHRDRLGAFACLSMHDAKQAGEELKRCVILWIPWCSLE